MKKYGNQIRCLLRSRHQTKGSATIFFSLRGEDQEDEPFAELLMEESLRWQSTIAGVQVKMTFLAEHVNSQVLEKTLQIFPQKLGYHWFPQSIWDDLAVHHFRTHARQPARCNTLSRQIMAPGLRKVWWAG